MNFHQSRQFSSKPPNKHWYSSWGCHKPVLERALCLGIGVQESERWGYLPVTGCVRIMLSFSLAAQAMNQKILSMVRP
jgi:hypothetical protein